jgi:hypothetical protein
VRVGCTISDRDIEVNEIITLTAFQDPVDVPVIFAFDHGDGTIDRTSQSRAYYREPGNYEVTLQWQHFRSKGSTYCGNVRVRPIGTSPTPTPTPPPVSVYIRCSISDQDIVVNEIITLQAFKEPASAAVAFVFEHGDGTLDPTDRSRAYYGAPGYYQVRLRWAHEGRSGTIDCGTVTVTPNFAPADYIGRSAASAEAFAASRGLVFRIVRIDGEYFPITQDHRLDRVNVEINNGTVAAAYLG